MEMNIKYTREEIKNMLLTSRNKEDSFKAKATKKFRGAIALSIMLIVLGLIGRIQPINNLYSLFIAVGVGIIVNILIVGINYYAKEEEKQYLKQVIEQMGGEEAIGKEYTLISDRDLIVDKGDEKIALSLEALQYIQESSTMLYVKFSPLPKEIIIPKRVFEDEIEKDEFLSNLKVETSIEHKKIDEYDNAISRKWKMRVIISFVVTVITMIAVLMLV